MVIFATNGGDGMPRLTRTTGTGITRRGLVEYDWVRPGDAGTQVRAAIAAFERRSFHRLSLRLAELATSILEAAGLPSDPEAEYLISPEAGWAPITDEMDLGPALDDARLTLEVAVIHCGVPPDSPQGYAARLLMMLREARHELAAGHLDEAMGWAFVAGELVNEAGMKEVFEPDVLVGEKVRAGGRRAHEQTYGTDEEKKAERADYLAGFDQEIARGSGKMKAYEAVAKRFGVSAVTIRRAVATRRAAAD